MRSEQNLGLENDEEDHLERSAIDRPQSSKSINIVDFNEDTITDESYPSQSPRFDPLIRSNENNLLIPIDSNESSRLNQRDDNAIKNGLNSEQTGGKRFNWMTDRNDDHSQPQQLNSHQLFAKDLENVANPSLNNDSKDRDDIVAETIEENKQNEINLTSNESNDVVPIDNDTIGDDILDDIDGDSLPIDYQPLDDDYENFDNLDWMNSTNRVRFVPFESIPFQVEFSFKFFSVRFFFRFQLKREVLRGQNYHYQRGYELSRLRQENRLRNDPLSSRPKQFFVREYHQGRDVPKELLRLAKVNDNSLQTFMTHSSTTSSPLIDPQINPEYRRQFQATKAAIKAAIQRGEKDFRILDYLNRLKEKLEQQRKQLQHQQLLKLRQQQQQQHRQTFEGPLHQRFGGNASATFDPQTAPRYPQNTAELIASVNYGGDSGPGVEQIRDTELNLGVRFDEKIKDDLNRIVPYDPRYLIKIKFIR